MLLIVQVTHGMFSRAVEDELDRILAFFRRKHDELQQRLQAILQQLTGGFNMQISPRSNATFGHSPGPVPFQSLACMMLLAAKA